MTPRAPYLETEDLQKRADEVRIVHLGADFEVPVKVELLLERMGIEIWPVKDLVFRTGIESAVIHSSNAILIDEDIYNNTEQWNRLRSSLAHEIGHYLLHRDLFESVRFESIEQWIQFVSGHDDHKRIEIHAHEFGGRLLVPREHLIKVIDEYRSEKSEDEFFLTVKGRLANYFWVSIDLVEVRLDREGLRYLVDDNRAF